MEVENPSGLGRKLVGAPFGIETTMMIGGSSEALSSPQPSSVIRKPRYPQAPQQDKSRA
jgi:hypothetical protein